MDALDLFRTIRGRWMIIAASLVVTMLAAVAAIAVTGGRTEPRSFEATAIVATTEAPGEQAARLAQLALLATAGDVPARAARKLNTAEPPSTLVDAIGVRTDEAAGSVQITARAPEELRARAIADAFAFGLVESVAARAEERVQRAVTNASERLHEITRAMRDLDRTIPRASGRRARLLRAQRDALVRQYSFAYENYQTQATAGTPDPGIEVLRRARVTPAAPVSFLAPSSPAARLAIAALLGLMIGVGIAVVLERTDVRLRTPDQAADAFGFPVLAQVPPPSRRRIAVRSAPRSVEAGAYRLMRAAFTDVAGARNGHRWGSRPEGRPGKAILVTSAGDREGKTAVAANLAASFAESGLTTAAISADLRRPTLHRWFAVPEEPGLLHALNGNTAAEATHATDPSLSVMPSGGTSDNPAATLGGDRARETIATVRAANDTTIIDTAGILGASDATPLLGQVDGVVVVARAGRTRVADAQRLGDFLRRVEAPVSGVVLLGIRPRS